MVINCFYSEFLWIAERYLVLAVRVAAALAPSWQDCVYNYFGVFSSTILIVSLRRFPVNSHNHYTADCCILEYKAACVSFILSLIVLRYSQPGTNISIGWDKQ